MLHRPRRPAVADTKNEIVQDFPSARRMRNLGMELHAKDASGRIGKGRDRRIAAVRQHAPAEWESRHFVAVTHPHSGHFIFGKTAKEIGIDIDAQFSRSVLATIGATGLAAKG